MYIDYDLQKINTALADFYNATGIDMNILKSDFSPLSDNRLQNCQYCDLIQSSPDGKIACECSDVSLIKKCKIAKKAQMHICHAGLVDVAIPISHDDTNIGYIILGRMKADNDFSVIEKYVSGLKIDTMKATKYYDEIPFYDYAKIQSITNIATMFVKYILLENILVQSPNDNFNAVISYINNNLENDLTIKTISQSTNISKSVLYEKFHTRFNCTVSEYIKRKRIEKSIDLLEKTNFSIELISQKVGFSSASYYSKMFKKQLNISPIKYKKKNNGSAK